MYTVPTDQQVQFHTQYKQYDHLKRYLDLCLAGIGLIMAIPIIILCALAIKLDSPGPVIFTQERVGKDKKVFVIYKLRTMRLEAEATGPQWAQRNDPRATRSGRILRKYRLDELPQLWNVLKGEMSLIGPRPERPVFVQQFVSEMPRFVYRTLVLPGLTGWAQVSGGYDLDPAKKLELDLYYITHRSLALDLLILLKTIPTIIAGCGAR